MKLCTNETPVQLPANTINLRIKDVKRNWRFTWVSHLFFLVCVCVITRCRRCFCFSEYHQKTINYWLPIMILIKVETTNWRCDSLFLWWSSNRYTGYLWSYWQGTKWNNRDRRDNRMKIHQFFIFLVQVNKKKKLHV